MSNSAHRSNIPQFDGKSFVSYVLLFRVFADANKPLARKILDGSVVKENSKEHRRLLDALPLIEGEGEGAEPTQDLSLIKQEPTNAEDYDSANRWIYQNLVQGMSKHQDGLIAIRDPSLFGDGLAAWKLFQDKFEKKTAQNRLALQESLMS
jgi:hypothetical protein